MPGSILNEYKRLMQKILRGRQDRGVMADIQVII